MMSGRHFGSDPPPDNLGSDSTWCGPASQRSEQRVSGGAQGEIRPRYRQCRRRLHARRRSSGFRRRIRSAQAGRAQPASAPGVQTDVHMRLCRLRRARAGQPDDHRPDSTCRDRVGAPARVVYGWRCSHACRGTCRETPADRHSPRRAATRLAQTGARRRISSSDEPRTTASQSGTMSLQRKILSMRRGRAALPDPTNTLH